MIIGCSGKARSGKGEFAKIAEEEFGATIVSFAAELKFEVLNFLNRYNVPFVMENIYGANEFREQTFKSDCYMCEDIPQYSNFLTEYGIEGEHGIIYTTFRSLLQWWGTEYRRAQNDNYWVDKGMNKCWDCSDFYVIDDCRFPNEAEGVLDAGGKLVRVERANNPNEISNSNHPSEVALDDWLEWEWIIENNTDLEEYKTACRAVLNDLLGVTDGYDN